MSKITPETVPSPKTKKAQKSRKLLSLSKLQHDKAVYELRLKSTKAAANPDLADYMKSRIAEIDKLIKTKKYLKEK